MLCKNTINFRDTQRFATFIFAVMKHISRRHAATPFGGDVCLPWSAHSRNCRFQSVTAIPDKKKAQLAATVGDAATQITFCTNNVKIVIIDLYFLKDCNFGVSRIQKLA